MSSLKEIGEYLFGRLKDARPVIVHVDQQAYRVNLDGTLGEAVRALAPQWRKPTLQVGSLAALVSALKSGLDEVDPQEVMFVVPSFDRVSVVARNADDFGYRHTWAAAVYASEVPFRFGEWYKPEDFLIKFRASFLFNDEAVKVQQLCSTVSAGQEVTVSDDGISQAVAVKTGTVTRASIELPADGVSLVPWRTFRDAAPVVSKFLLRMQGVKTANDMPKIALFEIDAKWQLDTIASIRHYLEKAFPEIPVVA